MNTAKLQSPKSSFKTGKKTTACAGNGEARNATTTKVGSRRDSSLNRRDTVRAKESNKIEYVIGVSELTHKDEEEPNVTSNSLEMFYAYKNNIHEQVTIFPFNYYTTYFKGYNHFNNPEEFKQNLEHEINVLEDNSSSIKGCDFKIYILDKDYSAILDEFQNYMFWKFTESDNIKAYKNNVTAEVLDDSFTQIIGCENIFYDQRNRLINYGNRIENILKFKYYHPLEFKNTINHLKDTEDDLFGELLEKEDVLKYCLKNGIEVNGSVSDDVKKIATIELNSNHRMR